MKEGVQTPPARDMQEALSAAEAEQFAAHLCPLVEKGQGTRRMALAYLWAVQHATLDVRDRYVAHGQST